MLPAKASAVQFFSIFFVGFLETFRIPSFYFLIPNSYFRHAPCHVLILVRRSAFGVGCSMFFCLVLWSVVRSPVRNSVRSSPLALCPSLFALSRRSLVRRRISVFLFAYMNDELQSRAEPRVGPEFLSNLWDEHMRHEFATHNTEDTLATMVDDAYVNHIPVLTGGVGKDALREFYSKRFIPQMPPDTEVTPVSRTIGADQLVDEMIFKFTHTMRMDWMLPGIPPTGKRVEVPLVAIVRFRGDKLAHEHIYWDQASVLVQLGLLDPARLPVAGIETARKVLDNTLPSNALMQRAGPVS